MGIVSRLRSYLHEQHRAAVEGRMPESEAYASQIGSIEKRAEMIRQAFVLTLYGLIGTIATCLLLGGGLYWRWFEVGAAIVFVFSVISLLCGMVYYAREVRVALSSVRDEAADFRFMELDERVSASEAKKERHGI
jgi:hypothetical protein